MSELLAKLKAQDEITINMVCMGNICRSPIAAAILFNKTRDWLAPKINVTSSGTGAWHVGEGPHPSSKKVWESRGYSYDHKARKFSKNDFYDNDLILVMDSHNYQNILDLTPDLEIQNKVMYLRSFDKTAGEDLDVPDPYSMNENAFEEVFEMIDRAVDGLLKNLTR